MRLKRLEMHGFKSFAQRTVVELPPGVTAVVGPNGCGKSNIVDALRWAMGEQSARHLRGHLMEDVVFNGSDSLPPTGMAEVSLTFDNEDGRGPAEYSNFTEIMVTRRLFRSGESEYSINKVACRLKDVIELFLGTGMGSKAYSIVEQGKVDELVNSKPEERRALIEEAAGTSKYKSRKIVAERKLERTRQNLLRVGDIVREIERQIRTMELQAKKAERYRALKGELREKDLIVAGRQRQIMVEEAAGCEAQLAVLENRLAEHLNSLHAKEAESEAVRLSLMEADREIGARQEAVYQQKIDIQTREQSIDFYNKDLAHLGQTESEAAAALSQLKEKLCGLGGEIDELNKAQENFVQLSLFEETFLHDKEDELAKLEARIRSLQKDLEREKEALIENANRLANLKNDAAAKEKRRAEITGELKRSADEYAATLSSLEAGESKRCGTKTSLDSSRELSRELSIEAAQVSASIQALVKAKEQQDRRVEALKERIQERRSRLVSLQELQRNYEGFQEGVRAIMLKRQQEESPNGVYGLVAEVIEAPEPYEKALTAVLGDRLQYVIVHGHEEGLEAIEFLKREVSGRGSFIPRQLSRKQSRALPLGEAEVVAPLLDLVAVKEGYHDVAEYLLSDVILVRDLMAGLALWNRNGFYSTMVTPEGEVIDPMGIVTGGSGAPLEDGFLAQRRRIREIQDILAELDCQLLTESRQSGTLRQELEQAEARKSVLSAELHRLALEAVRLEHEHRSAADEQERLERTAQALAQEESDLTAAVQLLDDEIRQCRVEAERHLQQKVAQEQSVAQKQSEFEEIGKALESAETAVTQSRIRNAALAEKKENTRLNLHNRRSLQEEIFAQIASREQQIAEVERRRAEIQEALRHAENGLKVGRDKLEQVEARLREDRQRYKSISMSLTELEESIKELRPRGEACQEEKTHVQLLLNEKRLKLQHLAEQTREKYDVDIADVSTGSCADVVPSVPELLVEIEELRGRLERMGDVNLAAIGEYEELTSRFQFMSQQKEDLEKSIGDLQQTITKLNRVCRFRFKESFEEINEKFQAVFPRLFRGGKARLVLTDESDYLETGVDIVVQPPGKKLQSITLLSGGEKALTAVSLLFAIFLTKPSPFCFLDEVDAPLDDANIDRFNDLIKEMSQFSQFVLVTHNKKSMQAAEVLYGITMAEPGVSKVVSVRMS
jgi:chromosome segregation protein